MTRARPRYLYRVVKSEQPDETAFSSPARQGRRLQPPITPEVLGAWRSVSFWDTPEAAEELARAYPKLGQWIATVELPPEIAPVPYGSPGHWDVEADPTDLLRALVRVVPVR